MNNATNNDDAMDRLLRESMAAAAPELSPAFDAAVLDKARGRRLPPWGRAVMGAYVVAAHRSAERLNTRHLRFHHDVIL